MKKIIVIAFLFASFNVQADDVSEASKTQAEKDAYCVQLELFGQAVMKLRQQGASSMSEVMVLIEDVPQYRFIVIAAYEETQWSSQRNKDAAVVKFASVLALECYKTTKEIN